jgi:DNA-binding transcriptional LysR family regulator
MTDDLNGMAVFVAVADAKGFTAAARRLGVSASAVSQSVRKLEGQLGVTLVRRTSRSVHLTEAGARLYGSVRPALAEVRAAIAAVGELSDAPHGTLRLLVGTTADPVLARLPLADFLAAHPHVGLDVVVSDAVVDIVAGGFDAGIQLGEVIARDMIAVPVTGDIRMTVVGAPSYFARRPKPAHPRDLVVHECINWHPTAKAPPYRWEFTENGRDFSVDVRARVLTNDPGLKVRLAIAGAGLTLADERRSRDGIASGELVPVLEAFSTPFPGFYLYYPERRQASPALRALVEHLRPAKQKRRTRG